MIQVDVEMAWKIPLYKIYSDSEDEQAVLAVVRRGMSWANGPEIAKLESQLSSFAGRKYCLSFNNGTSALHALLLAHGVGKGDEVIVPSFTFISTANAVLFSGAKPVFADIEEKTCALDPADVRKKITGKTKAIIPVHYAGCPAAGIRELKELAEEKGIAVIEDAAESLGAKLGGKAVGSFGDSAMFSFCANKIITGGEGGAVVTDSEEIYSRLKLLRSHGREEGENYFESSKSMDYVSLGYNYRMPSIVAALVSSQLSKIGKIISMRQRAAKKYDDLLSGKVGVMPNGGDFFNVYQMYSIFFSGRAERDKVREGLGKSGIMSKVYFDPVHLTRFYKDVLAYKGVSLPATEAVSGSELSIPIYASIGAGEIEEVCNSIKMLLK